MEYIGGVGKTCVPSHGMYGHGPICGCSFLALYKQNGLKRVFLATRDLFLKILSADRIYDALFAHGEASASGNNPHGGLNDRNLINRIPMCWSSGAQGR